MTGWWRRLWGGTPDDPHPAEAASGGETAGTTSIDQAWDVRLRSLTPEHFDSAAFQDALRAEAEEARVDLLRRARELLPDHPPLLASLARLRREEALDLWRGLVDQPAYAAEAFTALIDAERGRGDLASAARLAQRALAAEPGDSAALERALALRDALPALPPPAQPTAGAAAAAVPPVPERVPLGFALVRRLGAGGFGVVYEARDERLDRPVALKFLHAHHAAEPRTASAFFTEARLLARLGHPGVVRLLDVAPAQHVLTMEFCAHGSLRDRLSVVGPMPDVARRLLAKPAATLAWLHGAGVTHADLKPENLLFRTEDEVVVADFGVGAAMAGTPAYRAPEQRLGAALTPAMDVFGLGRVLAELGGDALADDPLLVACLAVEPAARPTMAEVAARLA